MTSIKTCFSSSGIGGSDRYRYSSIVISDRSRYCCWGVDRVDIATCTLREGQDYGFIYLWCGITSRIDYYLSAGRTGSKNNTSRCATEGASQDRLIIGVENCRSSYAVVYRESIGSVSGAVKGVHQVRCPIFLHSGGGYGKGDVAIIISDRPGDWCCGSSRVACTGCKI